MPGDFIPAGPYVPPSSGGDGGGGVTVHNDLTGKGAANQHPMSAITDLLANLDGAAPATVAGAVPTYLDAGLEANVGPLSAYTGDRNLTGGASLSQGAGASRVGWAIPDGTASALVHIEFGADTAFLAVAVVGSDGNPAAGSTIAYSSAPYTLVAGPTLLTGAFLSGDPTVADLLFNIDDPADDLQLVVASIAAPTITVSVYWLPHHSGILDATMTMMLNSSEQITAGFTQLGGAVAGVAGAASAAQSDADAAQTAADAAQTAADAAQTAADAALAGITRVSDVAHAYLEALPPWPNGTPVISSSLAGRWATTDIDYNPGPTGVYERRSWTLSNHIEWPGAGGADPDTYYFEIHTRPWLTPPPNAPVDWEADSNENAEVLRRLPFESAEMPNHRVGGRYSFGEHVSQDEADNPTHGDPGVEYPDEDIQANFPGVFLPGRPVGRRFRQDCAAQELRFWQEVIEGWDPDDPDSVTDDEDGVHFWKLRGVRTDPKYATIFQPPDGITWILNNFPGYATSVSVWGDGTRIARPAGTDAPFGATSFTDVHGNFWQFEAFGGDASGSLQGFGLHLPLSYRTEAGGDAIGAPGSEVVALRAGDRVLRLRPMGTDSTTVDVSAAAKNVEYIIKVVHDATGVAAIDATIDGVTGPTILAPGETMVLFRVDDDYERH